MARNWNKSAPNSDSSIASTKLFFPSPLTLGHNKLECFVTANYFHRSLTFMDHDLSHERWLTQVCLVLRWTIRIGWKQGILKVEVSLYHWPPVWLVWNQLYDNWQILFLFAKQTNPNQPNRRSMVQMVLPPLVFLLKVLARDKHPSLLCRRVRFMTSAVGRTVDGRGCCREEETRLAVLTVTKKKSSDQ
jgi:hypothetical protein